MISLNYLKSETVKTTIFFILIVLYLSCLTATSQSTKKNDLMKTNSLKLIDYNTAPYSLKNFDYVRECVLNKKLSHDTLTIELLSSNTQYSEKPEISFLLKNEILNINILPKTTQTEKKVYNKIKKRYETVYEVMSGSFHIDGLGPKAKKETFRFKGFKKCPTTILLNGMYYKECPTEDIESKTYKGSIINRINKDGFKEGVWLQFYETGELREKKYYENGTFISGKTFDKSGKDLHYVSESSGGITSMKIDSLYNK